MRIFVFGIGGTGSRVLRSLTMLMASGVKINAPDLTLVPVIIDTDAHNGDTARTRDLLRSYYGIRRHFVNSAATSQSDSFFNTQIASFTRLDADSPEHTDLDVQLNFQNQDNTFSNYIGYNTLSQVNKDIVELFYNDSLDDHPELMLNLSVGFKGNPNIGSVVFNDLANSQQFRNLESGFTQHDRVFIISSIFGGTGSAGFPTLVKLIRQSTNSNLARTKIGAVTVMPYFNLDADKQSAINSALFDTKTKAALAFYASDSHINSINALYYVADSNQPGSLPNVEGGAMQVNNSHVVEAIAATSVLDFMNKGDAELQTPQVFEFGADHGAVPMTIASFNSETKAKYLQPLTRFAYAAKIALDLVPQLTRETFYGPKELNIDNGLGKPGEYKKILDFFAEFRKWSEKEMASPNNGRAFKSFNFGAQDHLNDLVHGKPIKTGFLNPGLSRKKVGELLTKIEVKEPAATPAPEKYLTTLYKTATACLDEVGDLP